MRRTAALIVGGGPAGGAAAIMLARGGIAPLLIERSTGAHDSVCGAFLGWDALASLRSLGIDVAALGARPITRLRLFAGDRSAEVALPHPAAGLSRRRLDEALLDAAVRAGATVERGVTALRAEGLAQALAVETRGHGAIAADALFLATGKHELRGLARPRPSGSDPAVGLRLALPPLPELAGVIELHLFERGYAGLLLQEDGATNLCLSVAGSRLARAGTPDALLARIAAEAPALARRIDGAEAGSWIAISGVPYGWRTARTMPGVYRLGDQAAVIASLAGDGIAIALRSGRMAAQRHLDHGQDASSAYQRDFAARALRPIAVAGALRRLAEDSRLAPPLAAAFGRLPWAPSLLARLTRIGH